MTRKLIEQMLEALEWSLPREGAAITYDDAITAATRYLAQPEQSEPHCSAPPESDQLKAKNDSLLSWLGSNMTFYDVNTQCSTQHPNIPVLASVSKRIWYHATDNQLDFPFSQVVRSALQTPQTDAQQVVVLTDVAPQGYGELIKLAAWLLSPGPMWAIDELEGQTHIGHRQFSKAKNTMRDVICMKAIEIKGIADTLSVAPQGNKS